MHKLAVPSTLLLAALVIVGCSTKYPTGPSDAKTGSLTVVAPSTSLSVTPVTLIGQPVANPFCPFVSPFNVPFQLVIAQNGDLSVLITDITMRFTDTFGVRMPDVTLPAPSLNSRFGSMLVPPGSTRSFPLSFGVGCGTRPFGTLIVILRTTDGIGRAGMSQVTATVH